ncbi:phytanoyl-CoA dioxygenase family protein [Paenibacillus chitinolyticus]|uniref:Phytanoyl-CoA dioxygenase family protein n=1 Tax=Paenibacillus chitinolyticus TaxID=79263 RepID=A0ABT4FAP3_9BACL|nr:phytanoyl-CoA dioxygenase family protein [Paenibacillus chitinolyticus]MCY9591257.1 phytanoyl-CoA dioxygenase family protein [Paenibacillus chitinolyticus]MCY9595560.1 phytanoyl-CoA dioxygenase family protein [Paenibacillus chitinolyticus]
MKSESANKALPDLSSGYTLTQEQIRYFRDNGHICLKQVLTPAEITAYRPRILEAIRDYMTNTIPSSGPDDSGTVNLRLRHPDVGRFTASRRIAKIAADLMGVEGVRIYRDSAFFKQPGAAATPMHQDNNYMLLDTDRSITAWIPLREVTASMGSLHFISRSHTLDNRGKTAKQNLKAAYRLGLEEMTYGGIGLGDVTFHAGWTLHNAPPNETSDTREAMTMMYYEDGASIVNPFETDPTGHLNQYFGGQKTGETADTPFNPLVYKKGS